MNVIDEIMKLGSQSDLQKVFNAANARWKELDIAGSFRVGQDVVFSSAKLQASLVA